VKPFLTLTLQGLIRPGLNWKSGGKLSAFRRLPGKGKGKGAIMGIYHFTAAFLDQAVYDAARAINHSYSKRRAGPYLSQLQCETALSLLESGRAGDNFMFDAVAAYTGLEPVRLYSILHQRAKLIAGKKGRRFSQKLSVRSKFIAPV
jgi:hypothetical protein